MELINAGYIHNVELHKKGIIVTFALKIKTHGQITFANTNFYNNTYSFKKISENKILINCKYNVELTDAWTAAIVYNQ